jgi:hypothetical protein
MVAEQRELPRNNGFGSNTDMAGRNGKKHPT